MAPKMLAGSKRKQEEFENATFTALNILLQNGWLSARDLCRLETTNRAFKQWIQQDEAWKTLCFSRFPNTLVVHQAFIRDGGGYKMWYRHRISSLPAAQDKSKLPPLPPPSISDKQIMLLVDITAGGESAVSTNLTGAQDLGPLLTGDGKVYYQVNKPFVVSTATCWLQEYCLVSCPSSCWLNYNHYDVRIHFLRIDKRAEAGQVHCCLFSPGGKTWVRSIDAKPLGNDKYDWKNGTSEWLHCSETFSARKSEGLKLQCTTQGALIEQRLRGNVCFNFSIQFSLVEPGDKVAVTGFQIEAMYRGYGKDEWEDYDADCAKKTGVSLLHILDELQGSGHDMNPTRAGPAHVNSEHAIVSVE